jgi:hypothetical protein
MTQVSLRTVAAGTPVRFWTGLREGEGRTGTIRYDGVYECGGTAGVYIRADDGKAVGFVCLSHVEEIAEQG